MVTKPTIWPQGRFGVPQITPYTDRDGHSLLELIKTVRDYVVDELHPNLQKSLDTFVVEVEQHFAAANDQYVNGVQEFQRIHDAFKTDVQASIRAANDMNIADLMDDPNSLTGSKLRDDYTRNKHLDAQIAELLRDNTSETRQVLAAMITEILGEL